MANSELGQRETLPTFKGSSAPPRISRIGNYKIESLLHSGSMSYLYLAKNLETGQLAAVKILNPELAENKDLVERFLLEIEIITKASHDNIVSVYESGRWDKGLYIAMEYIKGITLTQFINNNALSKKRALEIVIKCSYALMHLHSHRIIHRDLKPENIIINEDGEVKLIDFGIAELRKSNRSTPGFSARPVIGTPSYMSPEQKENPLTVQYNTDIYSLAIITYELLTGKLSFGKVNLTLVDEKIRPILEHALKPNYHDRTEDIVDFITEISTYLRKDQAEQNPTASFESIQRNLLIDKLPKYDDLEVGFFRSEEEKLPSLYYDFFHLTDGSYFIFLANTEKSDDPISFLPIINIRGIIHTLLNPYLHSSSIKPFSLTNIARSLNEILFHDKLHKNVLSTLLHINPNNNTVEHITSMEESIYHLPEKASSPRLLLNRTPPLGSTLDDVFFPTSDNFSAGDICFIHSFSKPSLSPNTKEQIETTSIQTLIDHKFSESNSLARTMYNTLNNFSNEQGNFCLSLYRL